VSASVRWRGLDELRAALRQLPAALGKDASAIVNKHADRTADRLKAIYPRGKTGNLQEGVVIRQRDNTQFGAAIEVTSAAAHAHLWELGTENRRTAKGWNRGRMKSHVSSGLIAIAQEERREMYDDLLAMLQAYEFLKVQR
jgi:hypothetical protein